MINKEFEFDLRQEVVICELNRPALIDAMMIENGGTKYRCVYWSNGDREIEWLYANEIKPK